MAPQQRFLFGSFVAIISVIMILYIYNMPQPYDEGFVDTGRCGPEVGKVCPDGLRCMNGYCKSDIPPTLPPVSDLPVRPARYEYPVPAPQVNVSGVMNCSSFD